jgi:DNA-binding NarL/FixJ family response regulator
MAREMNAAIAAAIAAARVGDEHIATARAAETPATMAPERRRRWELDIARKLSNGCFEKAIIKHLRGSQQVI